MIKRPSLKEVISARETLRDDRKARKADRGPRVAHKAARPRHGRDRDEDFIGWLHEGIPCIACLVLGRGAGRIEAAHQKIQAESRGVHRRLGVRPSDKWCVPLCVSHHRVGPLCCDPAQAKFWSIVGLSPEEVADFCTALYAAFEEERSGELVVQMFASLAAGARADKRSIANS